MGLERSPPGRKQAPIENNPLEEIGVDIKEAHAFYFWYKVSVYHIEGVSQIPFRENDTTERPAARVVALTRPECF